MAASQISIASSEDHRHSCPSPKWPFRLFSWGLYIGFWVLGSDFTTTSALQHSVILALLQAQIHHYHPIKLTQSNSQHRPNRQRTAAASSPHHAALERIVSAGCGGGWGSRCACSITAECG